MGNAVQGATDGRKTWLAFVAASALRTKLRVNIDGGLPRGSPRRHLIKFGFRNVTAHDPRRMSCRQRRQRHRQTTNLNLKTEHMRYKYLIY